MALIAACVVSACGGAAAQVDLPAKPAAAGTTGSSAAGSSAAGSAAAGLTAPETPRQQVLAALTGYTAAVRQAEESQSAVAARRLLRPYLAASRIGGLVQAVSAIWASGDIFYGTDELHVVSVRFDGRQAFAHDCDDTAGMGLEDAATGQAVPGSAGVQHANLVTRLDEVAGHWKVESQLPEDLPCAP